MILRFRPHTPTIPLSEEPGIILYGLNGNGLNYGRRNQMIYSQQVWVNVQCKADYLLVWQLQRLITWGILTNEYIYIMYIIQIIRI